MCLELGEIHPDALLEKLSFEQLLEWQTYFAFRPFGSTVRTTMHANQIAMIAAAGGAKQVDPAAFLPWEKQHEGGDVDAAFAAMGGMAAMARIQAEVEVHQHGGNSTP